MLQITTYIQIKYFFNLSGHPEAGRQLGFLPEYFIFGAFQKIYQIQ